MFAPYYHAAFRQGIAPDALDRTALHVVAWMFQGVKDPNTPDAPEDLFEAHREREAWIAAGNDPDDFYVPDDRAVSL